MEEISLIDSELKIKIEPNNNLLVKLDSSVDEAYYEMVMSTSLNKDMAKDNITVVYSSQHGTGYVPVTTVLNKMGYKVVEVKEQCEFRGDFKNTKSPNPEEVGAYELAIEYAKKHNADIICCTDPDCDRVGIALFDENKNVVYMSGNQTGAILINYILSVKQANNTLANNSVIYNTIVSSPLGAKVAAYYGVSTEQTLTGFKYIGDKIAKAIENNGKVFQIGYEESYGYLINPAVRDKDGVQAILLICEMTSYYKHQGKTLLDVYNEIQQIHGFHIESQYNYYAEGIEGVSKIANIMSSLRNSNLKEIASNEVVVTEDYLSLKKNNNGIITDLDYEKSNVLRYIFDDGSFVAIRPSGTEPKVKFYFAICGKTKQEAQKRHDDVKNFIINLIK